MKKIKSWIAATLCLALLLSAMPMTAAQAGEIVGIEEEGAGGTSTEETQAETEKEPETQTETETEPGTEEEHKFGDVVYRWYYFPEENPENKEELKNNQQWIEAINKDGICITCIATRRCLCNSDNCPIKPEEDEAVEVKIDRQSSTPDVDGKIVYEAVFEKEGFAENKTHEVFLHSYGEPEWKLEWKEGEEGAEGVWEAKAVFVCDKCKENEEGHRVEVTAERQDTKISETEEATCTKAGKVVYSAKVMFLDQEYVCSEKIHEIPATGHSYEAKEDAWTWEWNEEKESYDVELTLTCSVCSEKTDPQTAEVKHEITEPTCTESGKHTYTATEKFGGKEYTDTKTEKIPATGHSYEAKEDAWTWEWNEEKQSYDASVILICSRCSEKTDPQTAEVKYEITEPTCTGSGKRTYTATVEFDGKKYTGTKEERIPATGHSYETKEDAWKWTWNEEKESYDASATLTCSKCSEKTEPQMAEVSKEETEEGWKEPTCTEPGKHTYTATVEFGGKKYTDTKIEKIPATGHSYEAKEDAWTWEWNEEKQSYDASVILICSRCSEKTESQTAEVKHEITEPTCTESGKHIYTATVEFAEKEYTSTKEERIPATGHSYEVKEDAWTWEWNEEKESYDVELTLTCSKCSEKTEPQTAEVSKEITTKPTCTESGEYTYTATAKFEGKEYTDTKTEEISAKGHSYEAKEDAWKWEWNEEKQSYDVKLILTCSGCSEKTEPQTAKVSKEMTTKPTCTEPGEYTYTATAKFDGKEYTDTKTEKIPATGHDITEKLVNRTSKKEGSLTFSCKKCGYVEKKLVLPKTTLEINLGKSANVISNASGCKFSLKDAKKYSKYFTLNTKTGKITTKKNYSKKISKSISVKVEIAKKTYDVKVKIKIPAPKITIKRKKVGSFQRYIFKYNVKGATKIKVRCNLPGVNYSVFDRYLSKPKSNSDSYVGLKPGKRKKVKFSIVAYYGKNVSEKRIIIK